MNTYTIGQDVRFSVVITEVATDTEVNPTTVRFKLKDPTGTITTYTYGSGTDIVRPSTGNYYCDCTLSTKGTWYYRWESAGTYVGAEEDRVKISRSNF